MMAVSVVTIRERLRRNLSNGEPYQKKRIQRGGAQPRSLTTPA